MNVAILLAGRRCQDAPASVAPTRFLKRCFPGGVSFVVVWFAVSFLAVLAWMLLRRAG